MLVVWSTVIAPVSYWDLIINDVTSAFLSEATFFLDLSYFQSLFYLVQTVLCGLNSWSVCMGYLDGRMYRI